MHRKLSSARAICVAVALVALSALAFVPAASAHSGEYAEFNNCPSTNPEVIKCQVATTNSGEVVLGKKRVPIVNPVVLQGGYGFPNEETGLAPFFAATNGVTLSKAPQPVPGGLAGLVNCKEISNWLLKATCEGVFENGLTGVNSTVELAGPASQIGVSEGGLLFEFGTALRMPVKFHLENPLLGSNCYVGTNSNPVIWNLTTGATSPPAPNKSISGSRGTIEVRGEDEGILRLNGAKVVDNSWSAPGASGCGGPVLELLLDPILNASVGVPAKAGTNTAVLVNTIDSAPVENVNAH
jgi:hypothetical protein